MRVRDLSCAVGNVYQQNPMVVQGAVVQGQVIGVGAASEI